MTITELIAEIKWEAKLEQDSTWDAHLILLIWDEMVQIANLQNEESLYISNQKLTIADQDGVTFLVALPVMTKLDRIEYIDTGGGLSWLLNDRNTVCPPVPYSNTPKAYELQQGAAPAFKLRLIPSMSLFADWLYVSYWKYPAVPVGGDTISPATWIQALKANCIRRALIYNSSSADKQVDMFASILNKAEAVSAASNKSLDITKDEKGPA